VPALTSALLTAVDVPHAFYPPQVLRARAWPAPLYLPRQVHGCAVPAVTDWASNDRPAADGLWTPCDGTSCTLGVQTADCVPMIAVAPDRVAVVHAGWRGVAGGIAERFLRVQAMDGVAYAAWRIALGPAAGGCCYEIGPDVAVQLAQPARRQCIDLRALLAARLRALGAQVDVVGPCTICGTGWASYRREGNAAGRNLAVVAVRAQGNPEADKTARG